MITSPIVNDKAATKINPADGYSGTGEEFWNWEVQVPDTAMGLLAGIVAKVEFVNVIVA